MKYAITLASAFFFGLCPCTRAADPVFKSQLFESGTLIYSDDFDGEYNRERWGAPKVVSENGPPHQKSTNVRTSTRLDPDLPMLSQVRKNAGYSTAHFGKWHLAREPHSPLERGFDLDLPHWWGPGPKSSDLAPWASQ